MINDFFGNPTYILGIGNIYPVTVKDWITIEDIAKKYLTFGKKYLSNVFKIPSSVPTLNFYVESSVQNKHCDELLKPFDTNNLDKYDEDIKRMLMEVLEFKESKSYADFHLDEMELLFSKTLRKAVKYVESYGGYSFDIYDEGEKVGEINPSNFDSYREVVCRQCLIFEPLSSKQKLGQKHINDAMKSLASQSSELSLESICALVSIFKGCHSDEILNYSYYRLIAEYKMINKLEIARYVYLLRSQGNNEKPIDLGEDLKMDRNPYSDMMKSYNPNSALDKQLKG